MGFVWFFFQEESKDSRVFSFPDIAMKMPQLLKIWAAGTHLFPLLVLLKSSSSQILQEFEEDLSLMSFPEQSEACAHNSLGNFQLSLAEMDFLEFRDVSSTIPRLGFA